MLLLALCKAVVRDRTMICGESESLMVVGIKILPYLGAELEGVSGGSQE